jgi:glycosyl transferase family 1
VARTRPGGFRSVHIYDFNQSDPHAWLPWLDLSDPVGEHPWIPRDAVYIGRTLLELAKILGPDRSANIRVLVTWFWGIDPVLPFIGDDVIVFCLGDELGRKPRYSHDVGLVAKTGGWTRRPFVAPGSVVHVPVAALQELRAQLLRLPSALASMSRTMRRRRRAHFIEIPLAPWSFPAGPPTPIEARRFDLSFAGSMTNEGLGRRWILPQKTRSRRRLISALAEIKSDRRDVRVEIRIFDSFHDAKLVEGYEDLMMQTKLTPCPRGGFRETYRLFEAAVSGCVPITEPLPQRHYYEGCPAVQLRSWSRLREVVDHLLADPAELSRLQQAAVDWWWNRCSPKATASLVAEGIDGAR